MCDLLFNVFPKPIIKPAMFYPFSFVIQNSGTKHIDPETGLIYFKYDFGYEFGIIFPGEGKRIVGGFRDCKSGGLTRNEISGKPSIRQAGDIEVPVLHEKSGHEQPKLQHQSNQEKSKASKRFSLPAHFAGGDPPQINVQGTAIIVFALA